MSTSYLIQTVCEILMVALLILSFLYEKRLINFEDKIVAKWKERKSKR